MIRLLAQTLILLALSVAVVTAAAWSMHLWLTPIIVDPTPAEARNPPPRDVADLPPISMAEFSQTLVHPLFFEDRRFPNPQPKEIKPQAPKVPPAPAAPPPPPKPVALPDKIRLIGVFQQSEEWKALIELPPQSAQWFRIGDMVGAWTIARIEENHVVLSHSVRSATLPLYSDGAQR
jgi:Tfp pilus assembly protein PilP